MGECITIDAERFIEMTEQLRLPVYRYCCRLLCNTADAEDMVQETMLRAYRARAGIKDEAALKGWLMRIAHNCCVDYLRSKRVQTISIVNGENEPLPIEDEKADVESELLSREKMAAVRRAIDSLKPMYRSVLVLRELEGQSYEQIAEITGLSMTMVKTDIRRARMQVAKKLREEDVL